ncbi:spoIIIJ-associated protein [Geodermatophilus pulveris]|uniref:SpoIIIJ-associated protein n=1 Tax=Geodermatophilus pulveris TaxID=1564159 RepID=A0A239FMK4_9ACTN|nr:R3H domain-containing nucleic acid-binding protein [Geodermatophilus pulveris]SNS58129.1 spoIIIJ-associated protein [Geodermatophilus pulveris]
MSAPQHPTEPAAPTSEATSGAVLSPVPTGDGGPAQPDLPDPDEDGADAAVEPADVTGDGDGDDDAAADDLLVREGDVAGDYLERLLDILDVDGDIDLDVEGDRASVAIVGGELQDLVGPDGAVLEALQELTRLAVAQSTGVRSRLMLDISGFRARRRSDLASLAAETARRVAGSRQPERLSAMNPFERKVVHDVIAGVAGVRSESEGEEPNRRVVVLPER